LIRIRWRFEEGDAILKRLRCDTSIAGNDCIDVPADNVNRCLDRLFVARAWRGKYCQQDDE